MAKNYTFSAGQIQSPQPWNSTIVETSAVVYLRREREYADAAIQLPELVYRLSDPEQRAAIALLGVTYDHLSTDVSGSHDDYLRVAFNRFVDQPKDVVHNTPTRDYEEDMKQSKNLVTYLMHWARGLMLEEYRTGHPPLFLDEERMNNILQEKRAREQVEYAQRQQEVQDRYKQYMGKTSLADLIYQEQKDANNAVRSTAKTATQVMLEQQQYNNMLNQYGTELVSPKGNGFSEIFKSMLGKKT